MLYSLLLEYPLINSSNVAAHLDRKKLCPINIFLSMHQVNCKTNLYKHKRNIEQTILLEHYSVGSVTELLGASFLLQP